MCLFSDHSERTKREIYFRYLKNRCTKNQCLTFGKTFGLTNISAAIAIITPDFEIFAGPI